MPINKGVLTCDKTETGDEAYTPAYAVKPLLKYIPKDKTIWCPFDQEWSSYYKVFQENGYQVVRTSIAEKQDYFTHQPIHWDMVVSNPPFSKKDTVLARLYKLGKPFAVLLPLTSLQGKRRYQFFKDGVQILAFDKRIQYRRKKDSAVVSENCPFPSAYFCRDILPHTLILEELQTDTGQFS